MHLSSIEYQVRRAIRTPARQRLLKLSRSTQRPIDRLSRVHLAIDMVDRSTHRSHEGAALHALRARTRHVHARLEASLALSKAAADRETYACHIAAMWGWMKPLESALWSGNWSAGVAAPERAVKVSWLQADIEAARRDGYLPESIPERETVLPSGPGRYGWAYVVEGSMLGGVLLYRRLAERLAPWPARYLQGYRDDSAHKWYSFLSALDMEVIAAEDIDAAAGGALEAFESLACWFRERGAG